MPRGDKDKYSEKQKRKAEHIEESYEKKGLSTQEAEKRAWATVNKQSGGGEKSGGGKAKSGTAKKESREDSAKNAANTRNKTSSSHDGKSATAETKANLMSKAREKNIKGRSTMSKQQLIDALKKQ